MLEILEYFINNDLSMVVKLAAGVILVGHKLPTKKGIWTRFLITFLTSVCWSGTFYFWQLADPGSILVRSILKYVCIFVLAVVCALFCLRIKLRPAIFCVTVAYCLEHMSQRIPGFIWRAFPGVPEDVQTVVRILIAIVVFAASYQLLIRHFLCQVGDDYRDNQILLNLALIVIGTDVVLSTLGIHFVAQSNSTEPMIIINLFSVLCSFLVLIISMCTIRMKAVEKEKVIVEQLLRSERSQYHRDNAVIDAINIKCHDLKHQIAMIESKLDQQELQDIRNAIHIYDNSIKTGNAALDVVLCNKMLVCTGQQINLTCIADGSLISFLREADIYSLFSNILDNAIDSVGHLEDVERRLITLTIRREHNFVFIHQENYFDGELTFVDGLPETSKDDKNYHGYGMLSIRTLVEKYNGDLQIKDSDGVYKLDIMLPLPDQSR